MKYLWIALLFFGVSCRYKQAGSPAPAVNTFSRGEKFRITLPENHDKKEAWTLTGMSDQRVVTRLNDVWHGNNKGIDFNFIGAGTGSVELVFVKRVYNDTLESVNYIVKITDN